MADCAFVGHIKDRASIDLVITWFERSRGSELPCDYVFPACDQPKREEDRETGQDRRLADALETARASFQSAWSAAHAMAVFVVGLRSAQDRSTEWMDALRFSGIG